MLLLLLLPALACRPGFFQSEFFQPQPAAPAIVDYTMEQCEWFLARPTDGTSFFLLEWTWGEHPKDGDILVGLLYKRDTMDLVNSTRKTELSVDVEDYGLDNIEALDRLQTLCCESYNPGRTDC